MKRHQTMNKTKFLISIIISILLCLASFIITSLFSEEEKTLMLCASFFFGLATFLFTFLSVFFDKTPKMSKIHNLFNVAKGVAIALVLLFFFLREKRGDYLIPVNIILQFILAYFSARNCKNEDESNNKTL